MSKRFTRESVDLVYEYTKQISYNQGFSDGYKRGVEDAKDILGKLGKQFGGEE